MLTIERNAKLQAKLIEDILDLSRIITGKLRLQVYPVNLITVIESTIESVRLAAEAKAIRFQSTLNSSVPLIMGDVHRLQQVVWNLLSNAIKFTPRGGQVEIWLEQVANGEWRVGDEEISQSLTYAQIIVSDIGQGIDSDFLPYVFDRFRQHYSSTTRPFGRLGLGLVIMRQIVELHGGTVNASVAVKDKAQHLPCNCLFSTHLQVQTPKSL